ncbi:MAG: hypothetical protein AABX73_01510 [Nanoarchaeota archaeon]
MTIKRTLGQIVSALDNMITIAPRVCNVSYGVRENEESGEKEVYPLMGYRLSEGTHGNKWEVARALAKAFKLRRTVDIGETFVIQEAYLLGSGFGGRIPVDYEIKRVSKNAVEVVGKAIGSYTGCNHSTDHFLVSVSSDELMKLNNGGRHVVYKNVIF